MKKNLVVSLMVLTALVLSGAEAVRYSGTITDWDDGLIDTMTFAQKGPWGGDYDVLQVEPIDVSHARVMGKQKAREAAEEAAKKMDAWCQKAVRETYGHDDPKILQTGESVEPGKRVAVLRWHCVEIDPGSRSKRFLVGFGAGHGGVTLTGEVVDRATGKVLVTFTHRRVNGAGFAITGGRYMKILAHSAVWTADDIGEMLGVILRTPGTSKEPSSSAMPAS